MIEPVKDNTVFMWNDTYTRSIPPASELIFKERHYSIHCSPHFPSIYENICSFVAIAKRFIQVSGSICSCFLSDKIIVSDNNLWSWELFFNIFDWNFNPADLLHPMLKFIGSPFL